MSECRRAPGCGRSSGQVDRKGRCEVARTVIEIVLRRVAAADRKADGTVGDPYDEAVVVDHSLGVDTRAVGLEKNGVAIDRQNRNPSRLSRMPGVTRNGNRQYLAGTNIGRKSWVDWMDFVEGVTDELPDMEPLSAYRDNPPPLPEELITGILRIIQSSFELLSRILV